jgi:ariadne-1
MSDDEEMYEEGFEGSQDTDDEDDDDEQEEDGNEFDFDEAGATYKPVRLTRQRSFEVLDRSELFSESNKLVKDVMDVLGIGSAAASSTLLRHMKWNKEKLIERYMENADKLCEEAGIPLLKLQKHPDKPNNKHTCLICLEENPANETFALFCGHRYCKSCWKSFLELKISEGPECVYATCPAPKCKVRVHEEAYEALVDSDMYDKYSHYVLKSFVDDNPLVKWCPAPNCTYSIRCERKERKEAVLCKCGFQFCFNCNDYDIGDHMPSPCDQVEKWRQKASDESENVTWMLANTKKCPECRAPIEKNGGCMHMSCKKNSGGCGFEFCWLCRGPWSEHGSATGGYYNCNKYDKSKAKEEDMKAVDAKTELEAYMFYYHRYESHRNAMKIADEQRKGAHKKEAEILSKFEVRSADTKFLLEATEQLIRNRRVLQYSYVYGYYLDKKSSERNLFEYLQEDLEKHTNHLSTLYETPPDKIEDYHAFIKWKEQVTNYTRITKKFLDNFVEGVAGGLTGP